MSTAMNRRHNKVLLEESTALRERLWAGEPGARQTGIESKRGQFVLKPCVRLDYYPYSKSLRGQIVGFRK